MKLIVAFLKREHTEEQEKVIDDIENILKKSKYRNFIYMQWAVFNWADRIGHGIKVLNDAVVLEQVKNNKIGIELCPTSNVKN